MKQIWCAILVFFLCIGMLLIGNHLGVEYDEALYVNTAIGCSERGIFDTFVKIKGNHCLPVMVSVYLGALPSYVYRIFFAVFGLSAFALRLLPVVFYCATMAAVFHGVHQAFGKKIALLTCVLLLLDVSFSLDAFFKSVVLFPLFLRMMSVLIALKLHKKGYPPFGFLLLGVSMGIAVWTKLDALFFYAPIGIAVLIVNHRALFPHWKGLIVMVIGGCIGAFPMLYFFSLFHSPVLQAIQAVSTTVHATWFDKITALLPFIAFPQIQTMTGGMSSPFWVTLAGSLLFVGVLISSVRSLEKQSVVYQVMVLSYLGFLLLYLLFPALEKSHHAMLMTPIPTVLTALWIVKRTPLVRMMFLSFFALMAIWQYHAFATRTLQTCGVRHWSCGLQRVIPRGDFSDVIVYDWGIATQLQLYSKNTYHIHEIAYLQGDELKAAIVQGMSTCSPFIGQLPAFFPETHAIAVDALKQSDHYTPRSVVSAGNVYQIWECASFP